MGVIVLATRNDVAKLANVSPAVVSYVINNSNYVSAEKRQAVLEAIEKLDYHPSYAAKSLKKHQTYQLLMLVDDVRTELFNEIGYYMEQYAFQRGYFVSIASCTSEKALKYLDVCFSKRYDGVFMVSNVYTSKHMNLIASKGIPVVLYLTRFYEGEKSLGPDICKIDCDYIGNIGKMIDYLIDVRRRRNIGYVISPGIGSTEDEQKPWGDGMRIWGYMRALERRGLPIRINNFFTLRQDHNESFTRPFTQACIREFMQRDAHERITALFASTDHAAAQVCRMLLAEGVRVPEDVCVVGLGDTVSARISNPGITTLSVPKKMVARYAVDVLISRIENKKRLPNAHFPMELVLRGSA